MSIPIIAHRALKNLMPLIQGVELAISGGSSPLLYSAINAISMTALEECVTRLKEEGKQPNWNKAGLEIPLKIAQEFAIKSENLRKIWERLLYNSLDPDSKMEIRNDDLEVVSKMNSSDCVLIMTLGKYWEQMHKDWEARLNSPTKASNRGDLKRIMDNARLYGCQLSDVRNYMRTVFNQDLQISDDDLMYSLEYNGIRYDETGDKMSKLFFHNSWYKESCVFRGSSGSQVPEEVSINFVGYICVQLTPRSKRIFNLCYNERVGY